MLLAHRNDDKALEIFEQQMKHQGVDIDKWLSDISYKEPEKPSQHQISKQQESTFSFRENRAGG